MFSGRVSANQMSPRSRALVLGLACTVVGFIAGRLSQASAPPSPDSPPGANVPCPDPAQDLPRASARPAAEVPRVVAAPISVDPHDATACPALATAVSTCARQLDSSLLELKHRDELRTVREGTPVPQPTAAPLSRFTPKSMRDAVALAFTQSKVPGGVQGIDCAEYPCIIFGRIRGAEDQMEKLEEAGALAAYEEDILTVLLWTATDETSRKFEPQNRTGGTVARWAARTGEP